MADYNTLKEKVTLLANRTIAIVKEEGFDAVRHSFGHDGGSNVTCDHVAKNTRDNSCGVHYNQSSLYFMLGTTTSPDRLKSSADYLTSMVKHATGFEADCQWVPVGTEGRKNTNKNYLQINVRGVNLDDYNDAQSLRKLADEHFIPAYIDLLHWIENHMRVTSYAEQYPDSTDDDASKIDHFVA